MCWPVFIWGKCAWNRQPLWFKLREEEEGSIHRKEADAKEERKQELGDFC